MQKTIKDLVVSSSPVRIQNYLGKIVVTYSDEDEEKCQPIFDRLEQERMVFCKNPIPHSGILHPHDMERVRSMIEECSCFVIAVSDSLFSAEDNPSAGILWYQVGQVEAKNAARIRSLVAADGAAAPLNAPIFLPVYLEGSKASLAGTPLQRLDVAVGVNEMMDAIRSERFASRLIKGNFYKAATVERFAESRITYGSVSVSFEITEKSFRSVQQSILREQQLTLPDNEVDSLIRKSVIGKIRLIGFGSREKMEPQFKIYENEIDVSAADFPDNFVNSKTYILNPPDVAKRTGIRGVLTVEFVIPIHRLLGVYYKPYLTVFSGDSDTAYSLGAKELLELLRPTFTSSKSPEWYKNTEFDTYFDRENARLYFNLTNDKDKRLRLPPEEHIGEYADHLYPQ